MKNEIPHIWTDKKRTLFGLPLSFTRYLLTESKLVTRKGFFNLAEDEFDLYRVTDKKLLLPFWQRLFGCGTIVIHVKDADTPTKEIRSVKAPRAVLEKLDKQIDFNRDRYNIRGRDMIDSDHCADLEGDGCDNFEI